MPLSSAGRGGRDLGSVPVTEPARQSLIVTVTPPGRVTSRTHESHVASQRGVTVTVTAAPALTRAYHQVTKFNASAKNIGTVVASGRDRAERRAHC